MENYKVKFCRIIIVWITNMNSKYNKI